MEKTKKELLEEMFPEVAKALRAIVYAGCPMEYPYQTSNSSFCHYCGEEYGHDEDCPYQMAEDAWCDLD